MDDNYTRHLYYKTDGNIDLMINCKKYFATGTATETNLLVEFCFTPGRTLLVFRVNHTIVCLGVTPKSANGGACIICTETSLV